MQRFRISCPTEVIFGDGAHETLGHHLPPGTRTVAFVRGAGGAAAQPVLELLQAAGFGVIEIRCPGEPSVASVNAARAQLKGIAPDCVVAVGGGSVMDTGKALAFAVSHDLDLPDSFAQIGADLLARPCQIPCIALPTTAGTGAEVTANAVLDIPHQNAKVSLRGRALFPATAIVDPRLMASAPAHIALYSGLDAVTQVIEACASCAATPFSDALSKPAVQSGLHALKGVMETGDPASWRDLAWVSLSSGLALANGGLGAAHGLASVIGGQYGAPHGALCGRLLLPVLRLNTARAAQRPEVLKRLSLCTQAVAAAFPDDRGPLEGFEAWMNDHNLPRLADWDVQQQDLPDVATRGQAASSSQKNALPLEVADYQSILEQAF